MNIFKTIAGFFGGEGGGLGGKLVDAVQEYWPPDMSEEERKKFEFAIQEAAKKHELALLEIAQQEQENYNKHVAEMEGTASDLNKAGWPGKIVLFARGSQRPVWGFFVMYMDFNVFSGNWNLIELNAKIQSQGGMNTESCFWVINFLVLTCLFGERALKNVLPMLQAFMNTKLT